MLHKSGIRVIYRFIYISCIYANRWSQIVRQLYVNVSLNLSFALLIPLPNGVVHIYWSICHSCLVSMYPLRLLSIFCYTYQSIYSFSLVLLLRFYTFYSFYWYINHWDALYLCYQFFGTSFYILSYMTETYYLFP